MIKNSEKINQLGPWVHGYFDLGNGIIIEDQDNLQKKRLFAYRDYFIDIILRHYKKNNLRKKTICDVGCNTGYFLFELFKKFNFKEAVGFEPRNLNLKKAKFIANYFNLPKNRYKLCKFDILTKKTKLPKFDIVLFPGVLHHTDNHLQVLSNIFKMTNDICIIETLVLSNKFNTKDIASQLELKDTLYNFKENKKKFGIMGFKLESNRLDGATFQSGIVGIPTTQTLQIMLEHVGFTNVKVYKTEEQLKKEVYNKKSYREYHATIIIATKKGMKDQKYDIINKKLNKIEEDEFNNIIPENLLKPLYQLIIGKLRIKDLPKIPKLIYQSEYHFNKKSGLKAKERLQVLIRKKKFFPLLMTFKHSPTHKIPFEYAKTCYHNDKLDAAKKVLKKLIFTTNLDWRTVYKSYYLLAKINYDLKEIGEAKTCVNSSLKTNPNYSLSIKLKRELTKMKK